MIEFYQYEIIINKVIKKITNEVVREKLSKNLRETQEIDKKIIKFALLQQLFLIIGIIGLVTIVIGVISLSVAIFFRIKRVQNEEDQNSLMMEGISILKENGIYYEDYMYSYN